MGAAIVTISHWLISKKDRVHKLRLAALERRLQVHQEAYVLWSELFSNIHKENNVYDCVMKCQEWWVRNCLYLDPTSRLAFKEAYHVAFNFNSIPKSQTAEKKQKFENIRRAGELIVKGVDLPTIGEIEGKRVGLD